MLKDVRKTVAKEKKLPPFVLFQDISLEDMATLYPITLAELENITGVSKGKAEKFGKKFVEVIAKYVEENNIERVSDFVVKQIANKSKTKVFIITNIDKKIPLEQIAKTQNLSIEEMWEEIESIISSGTKLNFDYHINDMMDKDQQDEIFQYFMTAETDDIKMALKEFDDDYSYEEMRAMRLKFLSEMGN
jgi:ATP-dependent DNA helicase RecQ